MFRCPDSPAPSKRSSIQSQKVDRGLGDGEKASGAEKRSKLQRCERASLTGSPPEARAEFPPEGSVLFDIPPQGTVIVTHWMLQLQPEGQETWSLPPAPEGRQGPSEVPCLQPTLPPRTVRISEAERPDQAMRFSTSLTMGQQKWTSRPRRAEAEPSALPSSIVEGKELGGKTVSSQHAAKILWAQSQQKW
uniref:Uncharacterized protein n=1 Tax=Molossus molossus TaxID=27622 RepID=A0A7J8HH16_MOLMO|nr:hypothetical protein HJG59_010955 [Molossus molossus]